MRGHIRKRGETWTVVVDVGRDVNGKRLRKWHGGFKTKRDAQKGLTEILGRIDKGSYVEPSRQTLERYLREEWLPAQEGLDLKRTTLASYRMHVETHIVPRIGALSLQRISGATINGFYADLRAEGRADGKGGLSPASVRRVHATLHKALKDAVRWQRLTRNPADDADPPKGTAARKMTCWAQDEAAAFLEHVRDDRLFALWRLLLATGMRRGEALGLRWKDIDLDGAALSVEQAIVLADYAMHYSTPKSGKGRRIDLDPSTVAALRTHKAAQARERFALGSDYHDEGLAFAREDGKPIHPDRVSKMFDARVARAGVPRIRLHDLRHTHASLLLRAGEHPKVVQERLGHANISITLDTYSHLIPAMQKEAATKVASFLG